MVREKLENMNLVAWGLEPQSAGLKAGILTIIPISWVESGYRNHYTNQLG